MRKAGARVCTKKDVYPNSDGFVGYGVKPDIEVSYSVKDILENKDPVVNAALKYLHQQLQKQ